MQPAAGSKTVGPDANRNHDYMIKFKQAIDQDGGTSLGNFVAAKSTAYMHVRPGEGALAEL